MAIHESGAWMARLLLVMAGVALVWLFAFVAESRADSLADGLDAAPAVGEVLDPESSTASPEATAPDDATPQAEATAPVTDPPVTDPPVTDPPVSEPPVTDPPVTDPPVTDPPVTNPPVSQPPVTDPPVSDPPVTDPPVTDPPVTDPPTEPPPLPPPTPPTTGHLPDETPGTTFQSTDLPGTRSDGLVTSTSVTTDTSPASLLDNLGMGTSAAPAEGTGSNASGGQSGAQKSSPSSPVPGSPWPPRPDAPLGGFAGGGVFGGSSAGGGGGAPMVLAGLMGLLGLWYLFGSRLSTRTTPLHGAAPAFQLKRPG